MSLKVLNERKNGLFFGELVVVKKPKADVEGICSTLLVVAPDFVLGVARSKWWSRFEPVAINNIHGDKISKDGVGKLNLFVPSPAIFPKSNGMTRTFCNYSMYKIAEFIKVNNLKTKLMFVHLNKRDQEKLKGFVTETRELPEAGCEQLKLKL